MSMNPFIGEITMFGGNFAPRGWARCEGQLLPIAQYSALFSILGTTYGGDGRTTLGLPDLRGRVPMGWGSGPGLSNNTLGQKSGAESTTLGINNMPNHVHNVTMHAESQVGVTGDPTGRMLGVITGDTKIYTDVNSSADVQMAPESITMSAVGGNQSFSNQQPYLVLNFIIALEGVYPSRS